MIIASLKAARMFSGVAAPGSTSTALAVLRILRRPSNALTSYGPVLVGSGAGGDGRVALEDGLLHLVGDGREARLQLKLLGAPAHPAGGGRVLVLERHTPAGGQDADRRGRPLVGRRVVRDGSQLRHELGIAISGLAVIRVDEAVRRLLRNAVPCRELPDEQLVQERLEILPDQRGSPTWCRAPCGPSGCWP